jgi:hypothetical protein
MIGAREVLSQRTEHEADVVLVAYLEDQYRAQHLRCALSLDSTLNKRFGKVRVIPHNRLGDRQRLPGSFSLLANEILSTEQLEAAFGRPPRSSMIREAGPFRRPNRLVAVYDFGEELR